MSNTPIGDTVSNRSKATLLTTFTSVSIALVQQIKNESYKTIAVPLVPFIVLLLSVLLKTLYKRWKCKRFIKIHQSWIEVLNMEMADPETTTLRKKGIQAEIKGYLAEIKRLQIEFIEIDFN